MVLKVCKTTITCRNLRDGCGSDSLSGMFSGENSVPASSKRTCTTIFFFDQQFIISGPDLYPDKSRAAIRAPFGCLNCVFQQISKKPAEVCIFDSCILRCLHLALKRDSFFPADLLIIMKNCIGYLIFTVGLICKPLLKLPCIPAKIRLHFLILFLFQKGSQHPEMLPHIMTDTAGFIHLRFSFS